MTTNLDIHPHNSFDSYSRLHGVHGGNGKGYLNGSVCMISLEEPEMRR
jgi:hypothetical protein